MIKTDWLECPFDERAPRAEADYVSMNPRGEIVIGRGLYQRLGSPAAFVLLFDAHTHRIGMRPAEISAGNAYPARTQGTHGARVVRGARLMREFGITIPETVQFSYIHVEQDGVLILELRTARTSNRGTSQRLRRGTFTIK